MGSKKIINSMGCNISLGPDNSFTLCVMYVSITGNGSNFSFSLLGQRNANSCTASVAREVHEWLKNFHESALCSFGNHLVY